MEQDIMLTYLDEFRPMISNLARRYGVECDDLMQEAVIILLETLPTIPHARNPIAYLCTTVRYRLIDLLPHVDHQTHQSINEPLSEDGLTLEDLLAAPSEQPDQEQTQRCDQITDALYAALRRLPLEEQMYMRRVHHLEAFQPLPHDWKRKPRYERTDKACRTMAYRRLRNDAALQAVLV